MKRHRYTRTLSRSRPVSFACCGRCSYKPTRVPVGRAVVPTERESPRRHHRLSDRRSAGCRRLRLAMGLFACDRAARFSLSSTPRSRSPNRAPCPVHYRCLPSASVSGARRAIIAIAVIYLVLINTVSTGVRQIYLGSGKELSARGKWMIFRDIALPDCVTL